MKLIAVLVAFLPYLAGAGLLFATQDMSRIAIGLVATVLLCTVGAYSMRRRKDEQLARQRIIVDPFLYAVEFVFAAAVVRIIVHPH